MPPFKPGSEIRQNIHHASKTGGLPLSMAEIARRINAKNVRPHLVKAAVQELQRHRLVRVSTKDDS